MKIRKFEKYLTIYGSDFSRWPDGTSDNAQKLIANSDSAKNMYQETLEIEKLLNSYAPPPAPAFNRAKLTTTKPFRLHSTEQEEFPTSFKAQLLNLVARPAFSAGVATLAAFVLLLTLTPLERHAIPVSRMDVPLIVAIEPFLEEWEQMAANSNEALLQNEEIFSLLVIADAENGVTEDDIHSFLRELDANYRDILANTSENKKLLEFLSAEHLNE